MQAIRTSDDPQRVLDAFWAGQIKSKEWLIENLRPYITKDVTIDIHGGWVGVLASMLFQSGLPVIKIRSIDIDHHVQDTANMMNKGEEIQGKFTALLANMCDIASDYDVIINTSCEHISQEQYDRWLAKQSQNSIIVVQSNNYAIDEHIRLAKSLDEFKQQSQLKVLWAGELSLPLYTRYMIIGKKHE
jgi:uncharacterized protein (DUF2235 family)